MSAVRDFFALDVIRLLSGTLSRCERDEFCGSVKVVGRPGGALLLAHGQVAAADSPGAPGVESLLLRSGRVSEADWSAALDAAGPGGRPDLGLVAAGRIGAVELRLIRVMAMYDAVFAMLAGSVEGCVARSADTAPRLLGAAERQAPLVREAVRRLDALVRLPHRVLPDTEGLVPGARPDGASGARLTQPQREILALADGRRTPRDLAFRVGRGVFTVTVEVSRMLADGVLVRAAPGAGDRRAPGTPLRRRVPRTPAPAAPHGPTHEPPHGPPHEPPYGPTQEPPYGPTYGPTHGQLRTVPGAAPVLPRREPSVGRLSEPLAVEHSTTSWKGLFRLTGRTRSTNSDT